MNGRIRSIDPLRHEVPIVDSSGRPTPQFMRQWMQARSVDEAVGVAGDSLEGLFEAFADHAPRHHAGGDLALDLNEIGGSLDAAKLYGDAELDSILVSSLRVNGSLRATEVGAFSDPEFDTAPAVGFEGGVARIGFSGDGTLTDTYVGRIASGVFGGLIGTLNRADELGAAGRTSAFHLDRANQSGTQDWGTVSKAGSSLADLATRSAADLNSGTLLDERLSGNVPLKNAANVFTANQTLQTATGAAPPVPVALTLSSLTGSSAWDTTVDWARLNFHSVDGSGAGAVTRAAIGARMENAAGGNTSLHMYAADTAGLTERLRLPGAAPTADQTAVLLLVNTGGVLSMKRVTQGAADSESAGFRNLRVPN